MRAGQQDRSTRGEIAARAAPFEQPVADATLERADRLGDGRLGQIDRARRAADALGLGNRCKDPQLANGRKVMRDHKQRRSGGENDRNSL